MATVSQLVKQAKGATERQAKIDTWLLDLPEARRRALEEIAKRKGFSTIERFAVSLLATALEEANAQRQRQVTRRAQCGVAMAERASEKVAAMLRQAKGPGAQAWIKVDNGGMRAEWCADHPGSATGRIVLDLRAPKAGKVDPWKEAANALGEITAESVAAWLLGFPRPDPRLEG